VGFGMAALRLRRSAETAALQVLHAQWVPQVLRDHAEAHRREQNLLPLQGGASAFIKCTLTAWRSSVKSV